MVDDDGCLVGVVTVAELARTAREAHALGGVLLAADLAGPTETVSPDDTLLEAVRRMGVRGVGALPVVGEDGRLLGMLGRPELLAAYQGRVATAERGME